MKELLVCTASFNRKTKKKALMLLNSEKKYLEGNIPQVDRKCT